MPMRLSRRYVTALLALVYASGAAALGFGESPPSVPFGQPLDVSIPVRLGAGESLASGCLSAHVELGERSLAKADVVVSAEPDGTGAVPQRLRVRSAQVVDEPVLTLLVSVGCAQRLSRQFVVFADPVETRPVAVVDTRPVDAVDTIASAIANPAVRQPRVRQKREARRDAEAVAKKSAGATRTAAAPSKAKAGAADAASPRLRLEPAESAVAASVVAAERQRELDAAVSAALTAQAAAAAASERVAGVERQLLQMRETAAADQAALAQLRERLGQSQGPQGLLPLLGALLALLLAVVAWLAWRVHALQRARDAAWAGVLSDQAKPAPANLVVDATPHEPTPVEVPARAPSSAPAALVDAVSDAEAVAALALPDDEASGRASGRKRRGAAQTSVSTRQISVEELIDLEQQAEFFCVLGQDESAIDLLMAHLRSSGGASPMPYLKLLEIYRQREDRAAYERIQQRFNQRFNGIAPDWESDLQRGRTLLDYDDVTARLQQAWHRPVDAMAELETLLFRKTRGELFELPAYRDVLMLYAVARDLDRHAEPSAEPVDVLLPFAAEMPMQALPVAKMAALLADDDIRFEDRATMPVDLDLNDAPADSRFGFLAPVSASLQPTH